MRDHLESHSMGIEEVLLMSIKIQILCRVL